MATKSKSKLSDQGDSASLRLVTIVSYAGIEIQSNYSRLQNDLQTLAQKIGELESEAEEHELSGWRRSTSMMLDSN